ncbi:MAG: cytochrome-c peroxidase, partial [Bacteroidota bacterium]
MKFLLTSCGMLTLLGWMHFPGSIAYPDHFPEPMYDFLQNPLREETVALGRYLFYEPLLSRDGSISCAACHSSFHAFAHTDHDLSHGIDDQIGTRNALPLFNLAWKTSFMWDGAVHHLDMQALAPISHPQEMGESLANVIVKLQAHEQYPARFAAAFPGEYDSEAEAITGAHLLKALSQFQL